MNSIQEKVLMMDEEGNKFWKPMERGSRQQWCSRRHRFHPGAHYHVKARVGMKYGEPIVVAEYFFSRLEDAEDKVRMIRKYKHYGANDSDAWYEPFGENEDGSDILFEDMEGWGMAEVMIDPIKALL
jgi:hypothetical protein